MTKLQAAIALTKQSQSSIFSKEDVIKILTALQEPEPASSTVLTEDQLDELVGFVIREIDNCAMRVDADSLIDSRDLEYDFSLDGNEIQVDSVSGFEIDADELADFFKSRVEGVIRDFFEEPDTLSVPKKKRKK
jgi:hypothetical protein